MARHHWVQRILATTVATAFVALNGTASTRNDIDDRRFDADASRAGLVEEQHTGNAIFIHPDGTALNHWQAARIFWHGADDSLEYDKLPEIVVYRGHMSDRLTGTSNGGATTHAFGVKVQGTDSYGRDGGRDILALSGYPGSFLREAGCHGYPIGVINDGDVAGEPGTGAFLAETNTRGEPNEQTRQFLEGRPGFEAGTDCDPRTPCWIENSGDRLPDVILGGGERFFFPENTPLCRELPIPPPADNLPLTCAAHTDAIYGRGPTRDDGRNLLQLAKTLGYVIMRTRAEFENVKALVARDRSYAPRILGLFAADDMFNGTTEEDLIKRGLVRAPTDPLPQEGEEYGGEKIGRLVLWGTRFNQHGPNDPNYTFNPPTPAEMAELGLEILKRRSDRAGKPFAVVIEIESTDNMPNNNNAMGTLRALLRADKTIGVARSFVETRDRKTLVITAADSDGSGIQLLSITASAESIPYAPNIEVNSLFEKPGVIKRFQVATDGIEGANTQAFVAEPDAQLPFRPFTNQATSNTPIPAMPLMFSIAWPGLSDFAGGILTRAEGLNAGLLSARRAFRPGEAALSERFDNSDVYRMVYATLFGKRLPTSVGMRNEDR